MRLRVNESAETTVKDNITAALSRSGLDDYSFLSLNSLQIPVLPLPYLTDVQPAFVYNLVAVRNISVFGENFVDAGAKLQCIFSGLPPPSVVHRVAAVFGSSTSLNCPFGPPAALLQAQTL